MTLHSLFNLQLAHGSFDGHYSIFQGGTRTLKYLIVDAVRNSEILLPVIILLNVHFKIPQCLSSPQGHHSKIISGPVTWRDVCGFWLWRRTVRRSNPKDKWAPMQPEEPEHLKLQHICIYCGTQLNQAPNKNSATALHHQPELQRLIKLIIIVYT